MATIAEISRVPKPLVLSLSKTALPEKTNSLVVSRDGERQLLPVDPVAADGVTLGDEV
jgi:hypothetical protein